MLPLNVFTASLFWFIFVFGVRLGVSAEDYSTSSKDIVKQQEDYKFPSLDLSHEHAQLSSLIYENSKKHPNLPGDWQLEYYENRVNTGNVMVISSEFHKQIGVVFCGTDGVNDWLDDLDITMEPFGPKLHPINHKAWVHSGFNSVLFFKHVYEKTNMFERIEHSVKSVWKREGQDEYEVILSGHSLGGALSVLAGTAFAHKMPMRQFTVVNYGCPRHGGSHFHKWSNKMENLYVWRFVYHHDVVPRVPGDTRFYHTGHTIQLENADNDIVGAKAYYHHNGSKSLKLAGVPHGWNKGKSTSNHSISNYISYLENLSFTNPDVYYVDSFEPGESFDSDESDLEMLAADVVEFLEEVEDEVIIVGESIGNVAEEVEGKVERMTKSAASYIRHR